MMSGLKKEDIRTSGIYLVIILAVLRLVILPLHNSLQAKKTMFDEYMETYNTKMMTAQKQESAAEERSRRAAEEKKILESLYPMDSSSQTIQLAMLRMVMKTAEKDGVSIPSYEFPDPQRGKSLSEVSVKLKLKAAPLAMVKFMKELQGAKRPVDIRDFKADRSANDLNASLTLTVYKKTGDKQ